MFHLNIAGALNKQGALDLAIQDIEEEGQVIQLLCLSETFIRAGDESNLTLKHFKPLCFYSRENERRGGVGILGRKDLDFEYKQLTEIQKFCQVKVFECCGIDIPSYNTSVVCVYRVPLADLDTFFQKLEALLTKITKKCKTKRKIIICGDFNIDRLKPSLIHTQKLEQLLLNYNFHLQIKEPTRITEQSRTCIDNIAINFQNTSSTAKVYHVGLSDHSAQILDFPVDIKYLPKIWYTKKRDYSKSNCQKFEECLKSLSFSEILNCNDANLAFDLLHDDLLLYHGLCFPLVTVRMKSDNKINWVTKGVKIASKTKRSIYRNFIHTKNTTHKRRLKIHFKNYTRIFKRCIRQAQKNLNNKVIAKAENKAQATWHIINTSLGNNKPNQTIGDINFNGKTVTNPQEIANAFNYQFLNTNENTAMTGCNSVIANGINSNDSTIYLKPTDTYEIIRIIKMLRKSRSCGYDGLPTNIIKENAVTLATPLSHIINLSMSEGLFPSKLKISVIKPAFKKGDKGNSDNYRPIALIPIISKIFENVIYTRLTNFFAKCNILSNRQFGFRKHLSTTLAILELLEEIAICRDKRTPITAIFMDMTKAFDFVQHNLLLDKLYRYGIRGTCADWIKSYLMNRRQMTEITKYCPKSKSILKYQSELEVVKQGVPQGSILGPLLFLVYINDLPNITQHKITLFADDCSIVVCGNNPSTYEYELNKVFQDVNVWLANNKLKVNLNKTHFMQFYAPQGKHNVKDIHIAYDNVQITSVKSIRFLGVILDSFNNWEAHVQHIVNKLSRFVFALRKLTNIASRQSALLAFHGHVMSNLRYGLILWGNCKDIQKVFVLQKKCIRIISGAKQKDTCQPLFRQLQILTVPSMYIYEVCLYVKRNLHKFNIQAENPRQTSKLHGFNLCYPLHHKTAYFRKSLCYMSIRIFNFLPNNIKVLEFPEFKHKLHKWCVERAYYKIDDHFVNDLER